MRHVILILTLLVLSGCQAPDDYQEPCGGYGCQYTETTELGIRYRNDGADTVSSEYLDTVWHSWLTCFGLWYDPDFTLILLTDEGVGPDVEFIPSYNHGDFLIVRRNLPIVFARYILYLGSGNFPENDGIYTFKLCPFVF